MEYKFRFYPESRFGGFTDIDGSVTFFTRVNALLDPSFTVLDLGCGRGACADDKVPFRRNLRILRGKVSRVIGIDVDPNAAQNPFIDEFRPINGGRWPVEDASIDLIVTDNVVEHVADPAAFFAEARRVLKEGGYICIRTPNRWSYVGMLSRLVPNRHHVRVKQAVQNGAKEEDTFPTVHRCNTTWALRRMMRRNGFDCVVYGYEPEPSYLSFSRFAYWLGVLHQRHAPRFLKPVILAYGRKMGAGAPKV